MQETNYSPMMKQYIETKKQYPEGILLFRAGDFYEMFYDDAKIASELLNITLTKRGKGDSQAPLAGIPYHSIDPYISKLIKLGKKVVICEQIENPKLAKGLVKRAVTRIITPSTFFSDSYDNNFLCSISFYKNKYGFSLVDITTGEFKITSFENISILLNELSLNKPKELLVTKNLLQNLNIIDDIKKTIPNTIINYIDSKDILTAYNNLLKHFNLNSLKNFGIETQDHKNEIILSVDNALDYLKKTQFSNLDYINNLKEYSTNKYLKLDKKTVRNLELIYNLNDFSKKGSLFDLICNTKTPLGYRKLYFDLLHPILDRKELNKIFDSVQEISQNTTLLNELSLNLSYVGDIERIISKIGFGNANPRDLVSLKQSFLTFPKIKQILNNSNSENLKNIEQNLISLEEITNLIANAIVDEPPFNIREGKFIKPKYSQELYSLINTHQSLNSWIIEFEAKLKSETGIKSLKIKYNKIFGYYIEVPKTSSNNLPDYFQRKQTLVNSERYTTKELSEKENLVLNANERRIELEYNIFLEVCDKIKENKTEILKNAELISKLDVYLSHAITANINNYNRPLLDQSDKLYFKDLRHPIIEKNVDFIPNDCNLSKEIKTMIITGPNMSGKSSYMRSVCIAIILGHVGSFVPAQISEIGKIDGVFTRIGSSDDIFHGQSTFLVEMSEISYILNNCTENSFVILDEVGRGTSTYDGLSLAWSIIAYLNNTVNCKTLVATHYHLLNSMQDLFTGIKNYHVIAKEENNNLLFFHKLREGGINKSYGIQVAKMAGLPEQIIASALQIQKELEEDVFLNTKEEKIIFEKKEDVSKNQKTKKDQKSIFDYSL